MNRIIDVDGKKMELLHRVSLADLRALLQSEPGLLASSIASYEPDVNSDVPFKLVFAEGSFSRVRCARYTDNEGKVTFYAQRKILSQKKLHVKHPIPKNEQDKENVPENHKEGSLPARVKYEHGKRENVLATTIKELNIVGKFADKMNRNSSGFYTQTLNKKGEPQIYQFIKIAAYKDLTYLGNFLHHAGLHDTRREQEMNAVLAYVANSMVREVSQLHSLSVRHRDIKPSNFLMNSAGEIILSDFGSVAFYNENQWEKASPVADSIYFPPQFLVNQMKSMTQKLDLFDQWSLALSILEVYGFNVAVKNLQLLNNEKINTIQDVKDQYKWFIERITSDSKFKTMPPHLQNFIKQALDINATERKNIKEMISVPIETAESQLILSKALSRAQRKIAKVNDRQIKEMMETLTTSSTQTSSSDGYSDTFDDIIEDPSDSSDDEENSNSVPASQSNQFTLFKPKGENADDQPAPPTPDMESP